MPLTDLWLISEQPLTEADVVEGVLGVASEALGGRVITRTRAPLRWDADKEGRKPTGTATLSGLKIAGYEHIRTAVVKPAPHGPRVDVIVAHGGISGPAVVLVEVCRTTGAESGNYMAQVAPRLIEAVERFPDVPLFYLSAGGSGKAGPEGSGVLFQARCLRTLGVHVRHTDRVIDRATAWTGVDEMLKFQDSFIRPTSSSGTKVRVARGTRPGDFTITANASSARGAEQLLLITATLERLGVETSNITCVEHGFTRQQFADVAAGNTRLGAGWLRWRFKMDGLE
jgi:hypothetical protein